MSAGKMNRAKLYEKVRSHVGMQVQSANIVGGFFAVQLCAAGGGADAEVAIVLSAPWTLAQSDTEIASSEMLWACPDEEMCLIAGELYLPKSQLIIGEELQEVKIDDNTADLEMRFSSQLSLRTIDSVEKSGHDTIEELDESAGNAEEFPLVWTYRHFPKNLFVMVHADEIR